MEIIDRDRLQHLMQDGAQVVEVLPEAEFGDEHITGAINIPLKKLDSETVSVLDRGRPVVVYCSGYT